MNLSDKAKNIAGFASVEIQGFFTERFINLCKINNIKIWDIRNIVEGVVRFKIHISDFKRLRTVAKKTKCQVKVKDKKGLYFKFFRYRKRKVLAFLSLMLIFLFIMSTCFVWDINVIGNSRVSTEIIKEKLKESGMYIGRLKIGMNKNIILKDVRFNLPDIAWIGLEVRGTDVNIKVVEKIILEDKDKQDDRIGDIIADKEGIITRIIPENGTPGYNEGSYVLKGFVLIEGKIYSKILEPELAHAKGIVRMNVEYVFEKQYEYIEIVNEYLDKSRHSIGFSVNSKEIYINYLKNGKKYDKLKSSKTFNLFGNSWSLDWYTFNEYTEKEVSLTKEDILTKASIASNEYINEIIQNVDSGNLIDEKEEIIESDGTIKYKKIFTVNERVGQFVERIQ